MLGFEKENEMYDKLIDLGVVTEEALNLVVNINGFNEKTMLDVLEVTTGYKSFDQLEEEEF